MVWEGGRGSRGPKRERQDCGGVGGRWSSGPKGERQEDCCCRLIALAGHTPPPLQYTVCSAQPLLLLPPCPRWSLVALPPTSTAVLSCLGR